MPKNIRIGFPKGADLETKIMIVVWELTRTSGKRFVTAEELAAYTDRSESYVKRVCERMTEEPHPQLVPKDKHIKEGQKGRKTALGYRLTDEAVIIKETARILIDLLDSYDDHCVKRNKFVSKMVDDYGMDPGEVNKRIDEAIKVDYIEKVPNNSLRGRERINQQIDYITYLAEKVPPLRPAPQNPTHLAHAQKTRTTDSTGGVRLK